MRYVRLGATGLEVSRLFLGCGNFGGIGSAPAFYGMGESEADAHALLDRAWDAGINALDTADAYGGGRSEAFIGRWLAARGSSVRERIVLSTKVFNPVGPGPNERGLSRAHIVRQIDASLSRLRTDRVDLYLAHEADPGTPVEETLGAFEDLVRAGKVLHAGVSNVAAWQVERAIGIAGSRGWAAPCCVQNAYSLLERGAGREVLPLCASRGLGFTAYSPLAGGWLTGKYRSGEAFPAGSRMTLRPEPYHAFESPRVFEGLSAIEAAARARGVDMSTLALAWVLADPRVTAAIVGPRRPSHLAQAVAALDLRLSPEEAAVVGRACDTVGEG